MIAIINYGSGNIAAISNIYTRAHVPHMVAEKPADLEQADHFLLPGVGAFDRCMQELNASGMREALDRKVLQEKKPILGICVGMQILADRSDEGQEPGLGWIPGTVKKFDASLFHQATRLPHMGWNTVRPTGNSPLFDNVDLSTGYYFLHSYYYAPAEADATVAVTDYAGQFSCAVRRDNVYGVQFHPEKSHAAGIQLLKNFSLI